MKRKKSLHIIFKAYVCAFLSLHNLPDYIKKISLSLCPSVNILSNFFFIESIYRKKSSSSHAARLFCVCLIFLSLNENFQSCGAYTRHDLIIVIRTYDGKKYSLKWGCLGW